EYFRIWIVNLLLMVVTFGIYYPWAKVRRLRYFFSNTLVGGQPLDFHGEPLKIMLGYFMMGILFSIYSTAGAVSAVAGLLGFLVVAGAWPAILKSSMQFRLGNTSWRGLRFRFRGSMREAYRAVVPMFIPSILILLAVTQVADPTNPPNWFLPVFGVLMLGTLAMLPWLYWKLKKFQHDHYGFASLTTTFTATPWVFYRLFFRFLGVFLLAGLACGVVVALAVLAMKSGTPAGRGAKTLTVLALALTPLITMLALLVFAKPYLVARLQNLVWNHTVNDAIRFSSELRVGRLLVLTIKNWLLIVLTLGFYWPFAAVATARMRLQAVSAWSHDSVDTLVSEAEAGRAGAAGDAGADLFGLDIGL
ncbi:MAG: hypothetical protein JWQ72_1199, partial [Polaromonas sp.]|nr:hypothetical protein [Polaromonas sp.]